MRISYSRGARADLDEIWTHIARDSGSLEIADGVVDAIAKAVIGFARLLISAGRETEISERDYAAFLPATT